MKRQGRNLNIHRKRSKKPKEQDSSQMKIGVTILTVVIICLLAGGYFLSGYLDERMNRAALEKDTFGDGELDEADYNSYARGTLELAGNDFDYFHNFENFLIMGTDISGNEEGEGEDFQNSMADFLLVMSIDKTADTYTLLELNRDTIADVLELDKAGNLVDQAELQLCTAHWFGPSREAGCENQVTSVSSLLGGLPISGYYSISMRDIGRLNQAIGGVTITLEDDDLRKEDPALHKGATVTLTDAQAEIFLRARMTVGKGLNTERMARQHQYLTAFLEQGAQKIKSGASYYYNVFESLNEFAVTNLTGKQISRIAKALTQNERTGLFSFAGTYEIGQRLGDGLDHAEFFIDTPSLYTVMTQAFGLVPRRGEESYVYEDMRGEWLDAWGDYAYEADSETMADWLEEMSEESYEDMSEALSEDEELETLRVS